MLDRVLRRIGPPVGETCDASIEPAVLLA